VLLKSESHTVPVKSHKMSEQN